MNGINAKTKVSEKLPKKGQSAGRDQSVIITGKMAAAARESLRFTTGDGDGCTWHSSSLLVRV